MTAPLAAAPQPDDLYDLAEQAAPAAKLQTAASVSKAARPIEYQHPNTPGSSPTDQYFPDRVRDLYGPLGLIGGGVLVQFGHTAMFASSRAMATSLPLRLAREGLLLLLTTAIMLVAVLIVGRLRKINFGPLPVAIMKLCAVAIAPGAVVILCGPLLGCIPFGRLIVNFAMFFAFLSALFDLDQEDTWYCVCVMFIISIGVYFGLLWMA